MPGACVSTDVTAVGREVLITSQFDNDKGHLLPLAMQNKKHRRTCKHTLAYCMAVRLLFLKMSI